MHVGLGYSNRSEKDAFNKAIKMLKDIGVKTNSISLDKYYITKKTLKLLSGKETAIYVISKEKSLQNRI